MSTPPPMNDEAEEAVLGAMLLAESAVDVVAGILEPAHSTETSTR